MDKSETNPTLGDRTCSLPKAATFVALHAEILQDLTRKPGQLRARVDKDLGNDLTHAGA